MSQIGEHGNNSYIMYNFSETPLVLICKFRWVSENLDQALCTCTCARRVNLSKFMCSPAVA